VIAYLKVDATKSVVIIPLHTLTVEHDRTKYTMKIWRTQIHIDQGYPFLGSATQTVWISAGLQEIFLPGLKVMVEYPVIAVVIDSVRLEYITASVGYGEPPGPKLNHQCSCSESEETVNFSRIAYKCGYVVCKCL
jgi:hypothetical protein